MEGEQQDAAIGPEAQQAGAQQRRRAEVDQLDALRSRAISSARARRAVGIERRQVDARAA